MLKRALRSIDEGLARASARFDRPGLLLFLFHCMFDDEQQIAEGSLHPQEHLTRDRFVAFVEHFLRHRYRFVSLAAIQGGLPAGGRYVHLTLDDGYANNLRLVEICRRYDVPLTLFVSTNHVSQGKAFWWDVVYRGRRREGRESAVASEISLLHVKPPAEIERYVHAEFGPGALEPLGDIDRPLTPGELTTLARDPLVTLGNHTTDHATLTHGTEVEVAGQIAGAQHYLKGITGTAPGCISFPHGSYDGSVLEAAGRLGIRTGVTTEPRKNGLSVDGADAMRLGRFVIACDDRLDRQLSICRGDVHLERWLRRPLGRGTDWQEGS